MTRRLLNVIDIETTGINEPDERIIEHCSSFWDIDTEEHVEDHVWRCNPLRKIHAKALKVHGIRLEDLENEPTWDTIAPLVANTITRPDVVLVAAHNGDDFDIPFIDRELRRVGHIITFPRTLDTMRKARWATANGKNPRLGELATCLDVPYDPAQAHGATYDCHVLALSIFAARRIGWFEL